MNQHHDWVSFWDSQHSIYVNARHFDVHYRDIADGIVALLPREGLRVLDYGCGEALHAGTVAAKTSHLTLCESAPHVRDHLAARFAGQGKIAIASPDEVAAMPAGSFDIIVVNSVSQYLTPDELDRLLGVWKRLLAPGGALMIGDVNPPGVSAVADLAALLRYAWRNGFLVAALAGMARTLFSDYRALRQKLGLTTYGEAEFLAKLAAAGFAGERLARNLEHNPARMTFRAKTSA
ncbi:MAG: class I SAM-dependent methyltransferase [Xanthobacteraceae bacterium]|uniref:class I SAM-dependent methyltransferase n=1 Tax=Pseudolabrys sp. TaxID=1960880 RepID=UPI003D124DD5